MYEGNETGKTAVEANDDKGVKTSGKAINDKSKAMWISRSPVAVKRLLTGNRHFMAGAAGRGQHTAPLMNGTPFMGT